MLKEENQNVSEFNMQGTNVRTENLKRKNWTASDIFEFRIIGGKVFLQHTMHLHKRFRRRKLIMNSYQHGLQKKENMTQKISCNGK